MPREQPLHILFNDARFVAVNKPSGLATIPGRAETDSVLERLGRQLGLPSSGTADPRMRVVHRLDKDTSGVLIFATDLEVQRHLSHQFQHNEVQKEYLALVAGRPAADEGDIDAPLAPHPTHKERMTVTKHGKPARTSWRVEQRFRDLALIRCFPKTGRTHQIRVHLASIGLPLAIDPLYHPARGSDAGLFLSHFKRGYHKSGTERPLIERLTLHAHRLTFKDLSGVEITLEAPIPKDLRATINMLTKYAMR